MIQMKELIFSVVVFKLRNYIFGAFHYKPLKASHRRDRIFKSDKVEEATRRSPPTWKFITFSREPAWCSTSGELAVSANRGVEESETTIRSSYVGYWSSWAILGCKQTEETGDAQRSGNGHRVRVGWVPTPFTFIHQVMDVRDLKGLWLRAICCQVPNLGEMK